MHGVTQRLSIHGTTIPLCVYLFSEGDLKLLFLLVSILIHACHIDTSQAVYVAVKRLAVGSRTRTLSHIWLAAAHGWWAMYSFKRNECDRHLLISFL